MTLLVLKAGTPMRREDVASYLDQVIDITIQLDRIG
jgi:hypothetical protein